MLSYEQIDLNRQRFLDLIRSISLEGADIAGLMDWLDNSDFFLAPANTQGTKDYEGGLCQHSLNVYDNLKTLASIYCPGKFTENTIKIVALLHDISKIDYYEKYIQNKKVYNEHGSKHDNFGNFEWIAEESYKVKDASERKIFGNHEETSAILLSRYIPVNAEELVAVMHHHCGANIESKFPDLLPLIQTNPLLALLHVADFLDHFVGSADNNE